MSARLAEAEAFNSERKDFKLSHAFIIMINQLMNTFSVFNSSLLYNIDDYDIRASLTYDDHPVFSAEDDYLNLDVGTRTRVKLSIEEV